jgi:hypothetical protein
MDKTLHEIIGSLKEGVTLTSENMNLYRFEPNKEEADTFYLLGGDGKRLEKNAFSKKAVGMFIFSKMEDGWPVYFGKAEHSEDSEPEQEQEYDKSNDDWYDGPMYYPSN